MVVSFIIPAYSLQLFNKDTRWIGISLLPFISSNARTTNCFVFKARGISKTYPATGKRLINYYKGCHLS